ncbi:tetratricopeptide repeat protein, partial [Nostoc sp. NIES-2111]
MQKGRFAEAVRLYQQMVKSQPGEPLLRFNLGLAQYSAQQYAGAVVSFQKFLQAQPGHPQANLLAAAALVKQKKGCEALSHLEKARALERSVEYLGVAAGGPPGCFGFLGGGRGDGVWGAAGPPRMRGRGGVGGGRAGLRGEAGGRGGGGGVRSFFPSPGRRGGAGW